MSVNIKQISKKVIASLLVIMLTITNFLLVTEEIVEAAISLDTNVTETPVNNNEDSVITISNNVEKFLKIEEGGVLLQTALTIDVEAEDLSDGMIKITMPQIEGQLPNNISFICEDVGITSAKPDNGVLTIVPDDNKSQFTYKIIYIYDESVWNETNTEKTLNWDTEYSVKINGTTKTQKYTEEAIISQMGAVTSVDINIPALYKGEILNNIDKEFETTYNEEWKIENSYYEKSEEQGVETDLIIEITSETPTYDIDNNYGTVESYFTKSKIGTGALKNLIGEDYKKYISVTAIDEQGNETENLEIKDPEEGSTYLTVEYPENTVAIKIRISEMKKNGNPITIKHEKKLVTNLSQIGAETLSKMTENLQVKTISSYAVSSEEPSVSILPREITEMQTGTMSFVNPYAQATLTVKGNTEWSALNGNQNVELSITMLSEDMASQKLFDNPVFTIALPEGVNVVDGTLTAAVSAGTLSVKSARVQDRNIVIELNGQTSYVENGANPQISINATINVDRTLPNRTEDLVMTYTNAGTETYGPVYFGGAVTIKSSNESLFTVMNVSVDNEQSTTYSYEQGASELGIDLSAGSTTATINTSVVNNYDVDINATVSYKVEYTNKEGKTETLLSEAITEDVVTKASKKDYQKEITIPEDISFNENIKIEAITTYAYAGTNYSLTNTTLLKTLELEGAEDAEIIDNKLMVTTSAKKGDGTVLDANSEVFEGEVIEYTITIANITNETINDLSVVATHTNGNLYDLKEIKVTNPMIYGDQEAIEHYYDELDTNIKTFDTVSIAPKSTVELTYRVVVNKDNGDTTYSTLAFNSTEIEGQITTISNKVKNAEVKTLIKSTYFEENTDQYTDAVYPINIKIENLTTNDLKNVKVRLNSSELEWKENSTVYFETNCELEIGKVTYNNEKGYIEFTISNLPAEYNEYIEITPFVKAVALEDKEVSINAYVQIMTNNNTYTSNNFVRIAKQSETSIKLVQTSNVEQGKILKTGDKILITTKITNEGSIDIKNLTLTDNLKQGFVIDKILIDDKDYTSLYKDGLFVALINLESGQSVDLIISATIDTNNMISKQVSNIVSVNYNGNIFSSNEVTFNADVYTAEDIEKEEGIVGGNEGSGESQQPGDTDESTDTPTTPEVKTYSIEGNVWLDINEDGQIGEENKLNGVTVKLIDVNNKNAFVKDEDGKEISVTTDSNGKYQISDLAEGNYSVIFMYDTNKYEIANNSIAKDYMLSETKVAITSTINLTEDKTDINLGLVEIKDFDLKLDKYITKVTTQTSKETKSTTYVDKQLARTEIASKYLSGASVIVEYTIRVTNSGELAGYVTKIQDNLPKDLKFSSELNTQWYMDTDGNLYNTSLASTLINPGESKEVKLILIKNMTTENTGTTTNTAKIVTTSNAKGYQEINSDNNASQADLMINPATGKVVTYVLIVVNSIIIVLLGVYIIKRKILN